LSFTRVKPGGYSVGGKVASSEFNQLDIDHANALDKTGDTTSATIHFASPGVLQMESGSTINLMPGSNVAVSGTINLAFPGILFVNAGGQIEVGSNQGVQANAAGAIVGNVAGGITATIVGGISPGVAGGITDGAITGGIQATTLGGIESTYPAGGIALHGGNQDWIQLSSRPFEIAVPPLPCGIPSGWTQANGAVIGGAAPGQPPIFLQLPRLPQGCTIDRITLAMKVAGPHLGTLPRSWVPPSMSVWKRSIVSGEFGTEVSLYSGVSVLPTGITPGTTAGSVWDGGGFIQQRLVLTPDQNNASIDTEATTYGVTIIDESGTGAVSGNLYYGMIIDMTVTQLRLV